MTQPYSIVSSTSALRIQILSSRGALGRSYSSRVCGIIVMFNIFYTAVINVASTHFKADKGIMDTLVHLKKKRGARGRGEATAGESVLATPLWGMLYADDSGVVSQSPEQLRKMMGVIVVVCAAFSLTVSEAKTEIVCLRAKGMPEATATFSVEAAGQVHNQTNEFVYATHGGASGSTPSKM